MIAPDKGGLTETIQEVVHNLSAVVQNEVRLAKAEATAAAKDVTGALVTLGAGLAFVIPALTLIGMAAASFLATEAGLEPALSGGIVGVVFAVIGLVLVQIGKKTAASSHAAMSTTADNVKQDLKTLKESVQ